MWGRCTCVCTCVWSCEPCQQRGAPGRGRVWFPRVSGGEMYPLGGKWPRALSTGSRVLCSRHCEVTAERSGRSNAMADSSDGTCLYFYLRCCRGGGGGVAEACAGAFGVEPAVGSPPPAGLLPRCCAAPGGAGRPLAGGLLPAHACLHARPRLCGDRVNKATPWRPSMTPGKGVCASPSVWGTWARWAGLGGRGMYPVGAWARAGLRTVGPSPRLPHPP